jgi:hypothetical protein
MEIFAMPIKLPFPFRFRTQRTRQAKSIRDAAFVSTLPKTGRTSVEEGVTFFDGLNKMSGYFNVVQPKIPVELVKFLTLMAIINPDISQTVSNFCTIGNTGHKLNIIDEKNAKNARLAIERLNQKSYQIYKRCAGIDGLMAHYFYQLIISGAISSEDVLTPNLDGLDNIVVVPVDCIRFKYYEGDYHPFQFPTYSFLGNRSSMGAVEGIPLNETTYQYYAMQTVDNSPYAVPPLAAALDPLILQNEGLKNLKFGLKKLGLLGLNVVTVKPLPLKKGENPNDDSYLKRNQDYIDLVAKSMSANFNNGILVIPEGQTHENHQLTNDMRGVKDMFQLIEELVFSGAKTYSGLHGRPYSTTETYATVIHNMLISIAANMRRLIKRRQEQSYRLDLDLAGIPVEHVSLIFNKDKRLNPNTEALANNYDVMSVLKKVKSGMISPTQGAQELGYADWYDEKLIETLPEGMALQQFAWDPDHQKYVHLRPSYSISQNMLLKTKNKDDKKEEIALEVDRKMRQLVENYLRETLPYFDQLKSDVVEHAFQYVKEHLEEISQDSTLLLAEVKAYIGAHEDYKKIKNDSWFKEKTETITVDVCKDYLLDDLTVFDGQKPDVTFTFGGPDKAAMDFYSRLDRFYFSSFLDNNDFGSQINEYMTKFLERGELTHDGWTDAAVKEFKRLFGSALSGDIETHMRRIINTSTSRIRNYAHVKQLFDADFLYMEIVAVLDMALCSVCSAMNGKRIPVAKAYKAVKSFSEMGLDEAIDYIKNSSLTPDDVAGEIAIDKLVVTGKCLCPLHVGCRCYEKGVFDE